MAGSGKSGISGVIDKLGLLRTAMVGMAIFSLIMVPLADPNIRYDNLGIVPDVLTPVFSFILVFVLLLDALMSRVFMSEHEGEGRLRFKYIIRIDLFLTVAMIVCWAPFMIKATTS